MELIAIQLVVIFVLFLVILVLFMFTGGNSSNRNYP